MALHDLRLRGGGENASSARGKANKDREQPKHPSEIYEGGKRSRLEAAADSSGDKNGRSAKLPKHGGDDERPPKSAARSTTATAGEKETDSSKQSFRPSLLDMQTEDVDAAYSM